MLDSIGEAGIDSLLNSKVLVIGCGALGSLSAMYLAATGTGTIGIADFDTIDISNLQRQLFFDETLLGKPKLSSLAKRMRNINSGITIKEYSELINEKRAGEIFPEYDFIIDGSDNPSTKKNTSSVCEKLGIPYCIGGVREFTGQVMSWAPGHTGYLEIFGDIRGCTGFTPCSFAGVLGPVAGTVASIQASEAIKFITGAGEMLFDSLLTIDLAKNSFEVFSF